MTGAANQAAHLQTNPGSAMQAIGLRVARGGCDVLHDLSLDLLAGTWTALVGPNAAGKSTLIAALAGVQATEGGEIRLQGRRLHAWPVSERARRLAWLPQQLPGEIELRVIDTVMLGRLPFTGPWNAPDEQDQAAVRRALTLTGTEALTHRRVGDLSGGERQRVLIARALATEAAVTLLDEPGTHLDAPHRRALNRAIRERTRQGAAVLSAEHDLNVALSADRVAVVRAGRLLAEGLPGDPMLHQALIEAFEGSVRIQAIGAPRRWIALPLD